MDVKNKFALITGGASGMGHATAKHLQQLGATPILIDVQEDKLKPIASALKCPYFVCDITSDAAFEAVFQKILSHHATPQIVVQCAGVATAGRIFGRNGPLPLEDFKRVIDINLIGTFNVMRLCAHAMSMLEPLENGERGVFIHTASIAASEGQIGQAAYSASKGAVAALTLPAARELARFGIRVLTISPGLIETPMLMGLPEEVRDSLTEQLLFPKRFGKAEEYAMLVAHIISNPLLNGETIRLDGALRMGPK